MVHNRAILPAILRTAIFLYLFCQILVAFASMLIGIVLIILELQSIQPPPNPPWSMALLFGAVGLGSVVLARGLFSRILWGARRRLFLFAAVMNTIVCINPIILIHEVGNTSLGAHITYGFPLIMNTLLLFVFLSRRVYTFSFPPKPDSNR